MKIVQKKKRKLNIFNLAILMFVFSLILSLASALLLRSYNNSLTMKVQKTQVQIAAIKIENDSLNLTLLDLQNKERVLSIATDGGLSFSQDNVVTISRSGD